MESNIYKKLVNFDTNQNYPRHSWFDIKEGYSTDLVKNVLLDLKIIHRLMNTETISARIK